MECKQCSKVTKKIVDCKECSSQFCTISCMMSHYLLLHNGIAVKKSLPASSSSIKTKRRIQQIPQLQNNPNHNQQQSQLTKLGSCFKKSIIPLTHEEFSHFKITNTLLGSGSYGNVYLAENMTENIKYSIKWMDKKRIREKLSNFNVIKKEIETHFKLIHPHIIRLYSYYEDDLSYFLIMEYAAQGNLFKILKQNHHFDEKEALNYFIQAALAVYFLHNNNYIHRDVKPENLLLTEENIVKLCDFGLCNNNSIGNRNTFCGTLEYMAPEILNENSYDNLVDVWSLGVLLYELTNGQSPFRHNLSNKAAMINFHNKTLSVQCKELMRKMLSYDPKKRINIKEIFDEPIITKMLNNISTIPKNLDETITKPFNRRIVHSSFSLKESSKDALLKELNNDNTSTENSIINTDTNITNVNKDKGHPSTKLYKKTNSRCNSTFQNLLYFIDQPLQESKTNVEILTTRDNIELKIESKINESNRKAKEKINSIRDTFLINDHRKDLSIQCITEPLVGFRLKKKEQPVKIISEETKKTFGMSLTSNCHLLDAINLVERAKIVKSQIEIPLGKNKVI